MSMTDTVGDVDIQSLEETFSFEREPCSMGVHLPEQLGGGTIACERPATWFLLCPADRSAETLCDIHRNSILSWDDSEPITFDGTCGHVVPVGKCLWEPYS